MTRDLAGRAQDADADHRSDDHGDAKSGAQNPQQLVFFHQMTLAQSTATPARKPRRASYSRLWR